MIYLQMKAYVQLSKDGEGRKTQKIIGKNKDKTPFGYPPVPLSMMWRADCFLLSEWVENKPELFLWGVDLN